MLSKIALTLMLIGSMASAWGADDDPTASDSRALRVIHIGEKVFVDRFVHSQTAVVVDDRSTAYVITSFPTGQHNTLRISKEGVVRQLVMLRGWPYLLDKKGRLFAMDISWWSMVKGKTPAVLKRIVTQLPNAAAWGGGFFLISTLNSFVHAGFKDLDLYPALSLGLTGFFGFYILDGVASYLFRSNKSLGSGANFFKQKITENVVSLEYLPVSNDFIIHYKDGQQGSDSPTTLFGRAPEYTMKIECIYYLSTLANE